MLTYLAIYLASINLFAALLTLHDKRAARRHQWRVRERTLLLTAALGGAAAMLLTMRIIRHKTKHAKFMLGLPVILAVQAAVIILAFVQGWVAL